MDGKVCLVTGANGGIGREVCFELARQGAKIVMSARNRQQAEQVRSEIISKTGNPNIYLITADLSSFQDVVALSEGFRNKFGQLDVLINNAGIFLSEYLETSEGLEIQWMVNYLAHYVLTRRLLDLLKVADDSRVINVSSKAHFKGRINFEDLNGFANYRGFQAYSQSKLANVLFTKELATRLRDTSVSSFALHPGVVRTGIGNKNNKSWMSWAWNLGKPFMISPAKGAATIVYLASSPHLAKLSGLYFVDSQPRPSSHLSSDRELASRLWEVSEEATKKWIRVK